MPAHLCSVSHSCARCAIDQFQERLADAGQQVSIVMEDLVSFLHVQRLAMSEEEWDSYRETVPLSHPIRRVIHQDPFTARAFHKPRGYAGDAVLIDYIYSHILPDLRPSDLDPLTAAVFDYTTNAPAPRAVRNRCLYLAQLIDRAADRVARPAVLSVAAGHLREAQLSRAVQDGRLGRFLAIDQDAESLEVVRRDYGHLGVETETMSIRRILARQATLGRFDLIYAAGLYDYLAEATGERLTSILAEHLNPGGVLLVPNFKPAIHDVGYMESYMGWKLILRDRHQLLRLVAQVPERAIDDLRLFDEEEGNIGFLELTRRAA